MNNKKKLIFLGLDVLVLVITIGVSLAVFNYVKKGENPNRVTAGAITMNFTEGVRNISLPVATPTSDEEGKSFGLDGSTCQNDSENNIQCYTDFIVSTNMSIDYSISYEVTLEKDEETTLNNEDVRIYLEKQDSEGNYKEVFTPKVYTEIDSENESGTDELGATNSEMLLDSGEITKSTTYNYRLRIWLSSDYTFTNETKDFVGKINVYGSNVEVNASTGINLTDNGTDINNKTITMQKGNTKTISAEVLPDNTKNKNLIWESSDNNKVKIDSAGNITAVDIGTSVITISTSDKSKSATFTINVVNYDAKSVELNTKEVTLSKGNTYQLTSKVTPTDAEDTSVTYKSSSEGIATISSSGLITAVGTGEATIIVETINGYTDTCKVIVTEPNVSSIVINGDDNVDVGSTIQLSTTITNDSIESSNVVWTSSDESKAIVSSTGKVTGIAPGNVTITAYIKEYPDIKAIKTIEVKYPEIKSITMSSDMTIKKESSTTFSIWISPNQVRNQDKIRWTSSNTSVATIPSSCNGNLSCTITGINTGTTTIKAVIVKIENGEEVETTILDTAKLTVEWITAESINLNETSLTMKMDASSKLTATITPQNADDKETTWSSSDESIAIVDENGNISAQKAGTAVITATSNGKTANCNLTVENYSEAESNSLAAEIVRLAKTGRSDLILDDGTRDSNTRYIGSNPSNYVTFNGETAGWRIVGVFNNIESETLIKIVRNSPTTTMSFGSTSGYWSDSSLISYLKDYGNSLTTSNLIQRISNMIETGNLSNAVKVYNYSKYNNNYEILNSLVTLPSYSDYLFSTSGGNEYSRETCINETNWFSASNTSGYFKSSCWSKTYLISNITDRRMAYGVSYSNSGPIVISPDGIASYWRMLYHIYQGSGEVVPVVYLKSNVGIASGNGTSDSPYTLKLN